MTERTANQAMLSWTEQEAATRAQWAKVLAKPAIVNRPKVKKPFFNFIFFWR